MKNWIARWFGGNPATRAQASTAPAVQPSAAVAEGVRAPEGADLDAAFYMWLCGAGEREAPPGIDKLILDELARLVDSPSGGANLVPRVPAVIPQLLRSMRDDSVSGIHISKMLAQDVVLVAEVIREANSPYYHPTAPVRTIEGAVMRLGQNGLRMLLARVAFRPIISIQVGQFAKMAAPQVWRQSELCAMAANILAPSMGAVPFEAYLAGLMDNVGLIVALRLIDQIYNGDVLPQSHAFSDALHASARTLSAGIARRWEFPASVVDAIEHLTPTPLAAALAQGDRVSKLRMLADAGQLADDIKLGLDKVSLACFEQLKEEGKD
ncbi:MAG: HDOD domain-containing protein [Pseudomonadota bacterium]